MSTVMDYIEKPTLLLDETIVRRNIQRMVEKARALNVRFRPHFKTHQSLEIGSWFREQGVRAITTSSVDMALYFAGHGWDDILIAFSANVRQANAIADLARRVRLELLIESEETAQRLESVIASRAPDAKVDIWIKVDVGAHRTGLAWDDAAAAARVAVAARQKANFRLRGLLTHAGHNYTARGAQEVCQRSAESIARIDHLRRALQEQGFGALEISVGDTPGASLCDNFGVVDEIRPGNFVFNDAQQMQIGSCAWSEVGVALACPVVARHPERAEVVIYGGAVHLSKDTVSDGERQHFGLVCLPEGERWGAPLPGAYVARLSQEHGMVRLPPEAIEHVQVGDLLCILPAHSCLTVTLMKQYLTLTGQVIPTMNL